MSQDNESIVNAARNLAHNWIQASGSQGPMSMLCLKTACEIVLARYVIDVSEETKQEEAKHLDSVRGNIEHYIARYKKTEEEIAAAKKMIDEGAPTEEEIIDDVSNIHPITPDEVLH